MMRRKWYAKGRQSTSAFICLDWTSELIRSKLPREYLRLGLFGIDFVIPRIEHLLFIYIIAFGKNDFMSVLV